MGKFTSASGHYRLLETTDLHARNLEDTQPNLTLEDTNGQMARGVTPDKPRTTGTGVNPYDTFPQVGKSGMHDRNAELRKLSAWIRQKRAAEELKAKRESGDTEED